MQALVVGVVFILVWGLTTVEAGFAEQDTLSGHLGAIWQGLHLAILLPFYLVWDRLDPQVWRYFEASPSPTAWPATGMGIALWWVTWKAMGLLKELVREGVKDLKALFQAHPWIVLQVMFWPIPVTRWVWMRVTTGYEGTFDLLFGAFIGSIVWVASLAVWMALVHEIMVAVG